MCVCVCVCVCVRERSLEASVKEERERRGVVVLHFQMDRERMTQLTAQTGSLLMDDGLISRVYPYYRCMHRSISTTQSP